LLTPFLVSGSVNAMLQVSLQFPATWGGQRKGAGRKARGRSSVPHRKRAEHSKDIPLHVTLRLVDGLPSMRRAELLSAIGRVFRALAQDQALCERFRVVCFSVQPNHLHLLIEASNGRAVTNGMRGLSIRLARAVNRVLGRKGSLLAERFHATPITVPTAARNGFLYVLQNYKKHPDRNVRLIDGVDVASSARWFPHWDRPPTPTGPSPVSPPRTWLLRTGWLGLGPLSREESPARRVRRH
jgi:REP element-mobilizing transposase RayT